MVKFQNYVIVGAGGIGHYLAPPLAKFLAFTLGEGTLTIIDGDEVEDKNLSRVYDEDCVGDNKAELLADICRDIIPSDSSVKVISLDQYLTPQLFERYHTSWYQEGTVIFGCVDNHKSRVYCEELCSKLDNGIFVTGGNSFHEGQSQMYVRVNGEDVSPKITSFAFDLLDESDPNNIFPDEEDCTGEYEERPQLLLANITAATTMLNQWYSQCVNTTPEQGNVINEVTFDITTGGAVNVFRREALPTKQLTTSN